MSLARIFVPQEALETWVTEGRAHVMGETLFLRSVPFTLTGAVRFVTEVAGGGDAANLVGKVKTLEQISGLGGEHCADSVVLDDNAYEVVEGFLAQPEDTREPSAPSQARLVELFTS